MHEEALNQIGLYLKLTRYCGFILNPHREIFNIDSYPDANFSGMHKHGNPTDPACVKSLAGYVITFSDCPVFLAIKYTYRDSPLNYERKKYLANNFRNLFTIIDMVKYIGKSVGLPIR